MECSSIRFAGYAGLFDVPDADRDTIRKGAFRKTLSERQTSLTAFVGSTGPISLLVTLK